MTARKLREWRGVKEVAAPAGTALTTRLRTTPQDDAVLDAVAGLLGRLRRADLAARSRPGPMPPGLDKEQEKQVRRDRLNARKQALTTQSSARYASTIIRGNDAQYNLERRNQASHIASLNAAISAIGKRLAEPAQDTLTAAEKKERRKARKPKGYATKGEAQAKRQRMRTLQAELDRTVADYAAGTVHVTEGGRKLLKARHNLAAAGLTLKQWQEQWHDTRWRIEANGSADEPYGNLTITITPGGQASIRLPRPLEHLANSPRGRYVLSSEVRFRYQAETWAARITGGGSVSYAFTRKHGRGGVCLTAAWAVPRTAPQAQCQDGEPRASGPLVAVDTNDGFFAVRRLDAHGNPAGAPHLIPFDLTGTSGRRDAQIRHAITRLLRYCHRYGITTLAVEELGFDDARAAGRETMGRGKRGKRFRRTVAGIPTAVIRSRLTAMAHRTGITLIAVNPAYTSQWGDQHWRKPYKNVTRHEAAATVIGRRAQGRKARRKEGAPRVQPEDCTRRPARPARPTSQQANTTTGDRPPAGTRGTKSRPPSRNRTRPPGRATVTPASQPRLASNDQPHP